MKGEKFVGVEQQKNTAFAGCAKRGWKLYNERERLARKTPLWVSFGSSHYFVFGTSLTLLVEGGSGMGFFEPQAMVVSSLPS